MKTWFITGTSKGFGRVWAEAALARGDQVVAMARNIDSISALSDAYPDTAMTLTLDVTNHAAVRQAVDSAVDRFGTIDVVINNAGFGLFGAVEEITEEQARAQLDTNLFGALWVTQAVLPVMRQQGSGHIIQVSSIGGVTAYPNLGLYHASKWGVEGFSQALSHEVSRFGIHVTLVEPGGYGTDWGSASATLAEPIEAYQFLRDDMAELADSSNMGDPQATGPVMLELVDMAEPPLRMFFGQGLHDLIHGEYQNRLDVWDAHRALSERAQKNG